MYILCALLGNFHCNNASIVIWKQSNLIWCSNDEQDVCVTLILSHGPADIQRLRCRQCLYIVYWEDKYGRVQDFLFPPFLSNCKGWRASVLDTYHSMDIFLAIVLAELCSAFGADFLKKSWGSSHRLRLQLGTAVNLCWDVCNTQIYRWGWVSVLSPQCLVSFSQETLIASEVKWKSKVVTRPISS